jgi:hypothetical protein
MAQPLDLEDARAEVGEEARAVRPSEDAREVEAVEEAEGDGSGHRRSIARRGGRDRCSVRRAVVAGREPWLRPSRR